MNICCVYVYVCLMFLKETSYFFKYAYSADQKFWIDKMSNVSFFKKSLMFIKPAFICSKHIKKTVICEILLHFKMHIFYFTIL